ncbi:phosphate ABC transporter substrate-binding protein PstS [Chitinophagaceae bacterium LB-8]|uniref:Phosphate-binding protein n=1 Tax=Paraflavisolibacter caeni TaxID=2982496 RepID=A0A9X2XX42_9BACT|nr:phosphate ABC transporter substrate-binding protein PstS [Paraflavisolibacter caeni]MCU7551104.1 phosphate ABC transporter substrate-binding protein PstS [Paraflavisolibacter caeni]
MISLFNRFYLLGLGAIALVLTSCNSGESSNSPKDMAGNASAGDALLGAGSTFIYPLFSKLFSVYHDSTGLKVNYQSIGSGGGILQLTNKTVEFGATDAALNEEQTQKISVPVLHIPMCSGAVVVSYNLPGIKDTLQFTPTLLADIFLGKVKKWNDPKIASVNKGVSLPDMPIIIAHRSDGSGTTNIFTTYLSKVNNEWNTKVGKGSSINWPVGLGGKGNEGVAGLIKQTPGAIGYIELAYALQNKMSYARLQNKSGKFITPSVASTSAAGNIQLPADAKVSLTDTDAPDGYPISGFTWAIIYKEQKYNNRSQDKATNLVQLLWWNIHQGQQYCEPLHYAPLSQSAQSVAETILKSATYDGKPILTEQ